MFRRRTPVERVRFLGLARRSPTQSRQERLRQPRQKGARARSRRALLQRRLPLDQVRPYSRTRTPPRAWRPIFQYRANVAWARGASPYRGALPASIRTTIVLERVVVTAF